MRCTCSVGAYVVLILGNLPEYLNSEVIFEKSETEFQPTVSPPTAASSFRTHPKRNSNLGINCCNGKWVEFDGIEGCREAIQKA